MTPEQDARNAANWAFNQAQDAIARQFANDPHASTNPEFIRMNEVANRALAAGTGISYEQQIGPAPLTADNRGLSGFTGITNPNASGAVIPTPANMVNPITQPITPTQGLQMNNLVTAQTANTPQYGQQGQVINPQANQTPTQGQTPQGGANNASSGLNFDAGQATNTSSPPQYDQQGLLMPGTGGLPASPTTGGTTPSVPPTPPPDVQTALDTHGITPIDVNQDPIKYATDTYNKVAGNLGLPTLKDNVEKYNKELLDFRNGMADKIQEINDNPWLTDGVRLKQIDSLKAKNEQKEANLLAYISLSQSLYNTGVQQAQFLSNAAIGIYQDQVNFAQQQILNTQADASKMAEARFTLAEGQPFYKNAGSDLVYSTATGKGVSYEQYIAQGGDPTFANVTTLKPSQTTDQTLVLDLISKDPGAGIMPTDSYAVASAKYTAGAQYRKDTYIAPSGGGGDSLANMLKALQIEKLQQDITAADPNAVKPPSTYQVETNARILQSVDELMKQVSNGTVGIAAKTLGLVPGTNAYNFQSQLDTLKSNISFGALTAMREASKTGGALGQISDRENQLLSATLGALDTGQSASSFTTQLNKIKTSITTWNDAMQQNVGTTGGTTNTNDTNNPWGLTPPQ